MFDTARPSQVVSGRGSGVRGNGATEHPKGDGSPARLVSLGTVRGAPALQVAWNLPRATVFAATRGKGDAFGPDSVSLGVSRGTYSSPSSPLLLSFSLPARLSASRKIHSTCAFALRMSSSAQRSTAAQIFGSMRRGYCLRRATNVCSCEC